MQECTKCHVPKPLEEFYNKKRNKNGKEERCKKCKAKYEKKRRVLLRGKGLCEHCGKVTVVSTHYCFDCSKQKSDLNIKRKYNLTREEWQQKLEEQEYKCKICKRLFENNICVDHNHITNEVRGLLCYACNVAIGCLQDDPFTCRLAADYLESYQ